MYKPNPNQNTDDFLFRFRKTMLKCLWEHERPQRVKAILNNINSGIAQCSFKTYYRAAFKTSMNKLEIPDINPNICNQWIFDKWIKSKQGERILSPTNGAWEVGSKCAEFWNKIPTKHLLQKSTLNGSKI